MQTKICLIAMLLVLAAARTYPLYKQCDTRWGSEHLGTSTTTICQAGCLMSSVAMALAGCGHSYNPSTLNTWLKGHGGYVSGDEFVWGSVKPLGFAYEGKIANSQIGSHLSAGNIVILNVHSGRHWVLATSISGSTVSVHDPGFSTTSYTLSEIVAGQTSVYKVGNGHANTFLNSLELVLKTSNKRQALLNALDALISE
jgi:hypothetical protein